MAEVSYVNTVNINLTSTPQGLSSFVVANIGLFTTDTPGFADDYRVYVSSASVADDFGSDSLTAKMANAIFAQSPNLRSGTGSLIIAPYVSTNAKSGYVETNDIAANVENFKSVTDGEILITADGNEIKLTKLDFSGVKTIDDIVTVLLSKNPDVFIQVVESNKIRFTSKRVGTDSTIALSSAAGEGTDITGASYLNASGLSPVAGTNAVDGEKLSDAVTRINNKIFFGGVLDTCMRENASIEENAKAIEAISKKVYVDVTGSLNNIEDLGTTIKQGGYKKTRILAYSKNSLEDAKCMAAAYLSKAMCTNYKGSNTCITMNLKELATITPDDNCSDNTLQKARTNGVDIYALTGGLGCVYSCRNAGGYMDDQTGNAAFTGELEVAAFNYLKQTNTKIPQTETGMTGLKNSLAQVCERFVNNAFIGKGLTWNSSEKFGDPEDFDRNITENGYYIYSLPIAQQDQAERESRTAPLIQLAAKSAGALHIVNVNGVIEA